MGAEPDPLPPRYSAVVTTWNAREVLERCLESLAAQHLDAPLETIVVDDGSTDSTAEMLEGRDGVRVIHNQESRGFGAASNQGAHAAGGEVLFFLNADTVLLQPDALQRLADALVDPRVGLVGPRLENPDGSLQPSCVGQPTILRSLAVALGAQRVLPDAARATVHPAVWSHDRSGSTGWLTGAVLAIRAELFASVGGFWQRLYGEDADLALKVRRTGRDVRFVADARVLHLGGHSIGQQRSDASRAGVVAGSELELLAAHNGAARALIIRAITGLGYGARAALLRIAGRRQRARIYAAMARVYAGTARAGSPHSAA